METGESAATAGENTEKTPLQTLVDRYLEGIEVENTRSTYEYQLGEWLDWIKKNRGITRVEKLESIDCRRYATWLKRQSNDGELKASTARTYYATVRAFLTWCVGEERIDTNPAKANKATSELPEDVGDVDRQFWTVDQRERLLSHVQERAHDALDGSTADRAARVFRDRALAYMLALSGVRGAEVVRTAGDDRRDGLRWKDVDLDQQTARVLGKSRQVEDVPLPEQVVEVLDRHRRTQQPVTEAWPVFPTGHRPTIKRALEDAVGSEVVDDRLQDATLDELLEEFEVPPPAITVDGVRTVMERLTKAAGIDVDDYLKPHGGRRGVGDALYRSDPKLAQLALRHQSLETTHESYQDIQAGEIADDMDDVLGR